MTRYQSFTLLVLPMLLSLAPMDLDTVHRGSYVCTPCGLACDSVRHDQPGTCSVCNMRLVEESTVNFKNIDFEELCALLKANREVLLLDVRSPEEFNNSTRDVESFGKFKGAININVTELERRIGELDKYKDKTVVVYCSHSHRSPRASYLLGLSGFQHVVNVKEGVSALTQATGLECLKSDFIPFNR